MYTTDDEARDSLVKRGYAFVAAFEGIEEGARVRNRGEQYPAAYAHGTARVLAVFRRYGYWEQKYGGPDVEVVVERDDGDHPGGKIGVWADYGTVLV